MNFELRKIIFIFTDSLEEGVCTTLTQFDEGYDYPIYYASRQLTSVEMNYMITERQD